MNCQTKLSFSNETSLMLKSAYFSFIFQSKMTIFQIITVRNWWIVKLKNCFRMSFDQKQPKTDRYHVL